MKRILYSIVSLLLLICAVYGFVIDIQRSNILWIVVEILTGGVVAVIRGILFYFGII